MQHTAGDISVRTDIRPGDIGAVVHLHGIVYAREFGFDHTFEAYVAAPLAEFARLGAPRERLWLAERDGRLVGCVAIVAAGAEVAQLRWFLVDPAARGAGLGRRLLTAAIEFSRESGYRRISLWTVSACADAGRLYRATGFRKVEEKPLQPGFGSHVIHERYEMALDP